MPLTPSPAQACPASEAFSIDLHAQKGIGKLVAPENIMGDYAVGGCKLVKGILAALSRRITGVYRWACCLHIGDELVVSLGRAVRFEA